jgi:hypothetical protein
MRPAGASAFVRALLLGDNLEEAEAAAKQVIDSTAIDILPDQTCDEALRALVRAPDDLRLCLDDLKDATVLGGENDPTRPGADRA